MYKIHTYIYIHIFIWLLSWKFKVKYNTKTHPIPTIVVSTNLQKLINFVLQKFIFTKQFGVAIYIHPKSFCFIFFLLCLETSYYLPYLALSSFKTQSFAREKQ